VLQQLPLDSRLQLGESHDCVPDHGC
jgi:hypothetical protein